MTDTNQGFPLEKGRTDKPNIKRKRWGHESEYTLALREKSLDAIITVGCELCKVSVRRTARGGIAWFKKHVDTPTHKRNVEKRNK